MPRKTKEGPKVEEARLAYVAEAPPVRVFPVYGSTKLSSKNQLTLPVAYVRHLGLNPGDELNVWLEKDHVVIEKRLYGEELLDSLQGSMKDPAWKTKEDIDAWVKRERDSWERDWDTPSS
jgi:bifunctional DNA-binding transcriptional regulator/antitoxin component of YhaV-PrlF toxin-antitoxin module